MNGHCTSAFGLIGDKVVALTRICNTPQKHSTHMHICWTTHTAMHAYFQGVHVGIHSIQTVQPSKQPTYTLAWYTMLQWGGTTQGNKEGNKMARMVEY